jgi:hypothetical protein
MVEGILVSSETSAKLNALVELLGERQFFQYETPEQGHSKDAHSWNARLHKMSDETKLDFDCRSSWYEKTTSAVMLGNPAIRHNVTRRFHLSKVGDKWYFISGHQSMHHEYSQLSDRDLEVSELDTYVDQITHVIRLKAA